jgi:hypothetical protein
MNDDNYQIEKAIWTTDDFEMMGWHDCRIHALAFTGEWDLSFDIDYICKWVESKKKDKFYFWIAPATLVFHGVSKVKTKIDVPSLLEIFELEKPSKTKNHWRVEFIEGEMQFESTGFTQYIRSKPVCKRSQHLNLETRNGISFATTTFD